MTTHHAFLELLGPAMPGAACVGPLAPLWDDHLDRPEAKGDRAKRHEKAASWCRRCPEQPACLQARLTDDRRPGGVWGGEVFAEKAHLPEQFEQVSRPQSQPTDPDRCEICDGPLTESQRRRHARSCGERCRQSLDNALRRERRRAGRAGVAA